ncbi:MAG: nodulation protein NfeD [Candidatus Omnitrophica bacterium]|nr:nodulation protein NfeD [Candidatus Omnitrophota bacterium]
MRAAAAILSLLVCGGPLFAEEPHPVLLLEVEGTINPAQARYVTRGLEEARNREAPAVVIRLDTPGGLDGSMRKIVQAILDSPVPVIVYVAPPGARAASAGALIALSAHVAAMAPTTTIGAAHPVQIGGEQPAAGGAMEEKLTNDAAAYIRSIAETRGRNAEWAEQAVRKSVSSSAAEAKQKGVIDFVAADLDDLLGQAEGKEVRTVFGVTTLSLKGLPRRPLPMTAVERGLHGLAHPTLAYILLLLGIYGLIYELATPGAVFPGVLGALFLVLSLVALETLEVNWAGMLLIGLSVLFFIADIKLPGYGALTLGGIIAFVLGSALLFPGMRVPHLRLAWSVIGAAGAVTAAFFIGIVGAALRALHRKVQSGIEGLVRAEGEAKTDLKPEGIAHIRGEDWQARSHTGVHIRKGTPVRVVELQGLTVRVEEKKESRS